MRNHRPQWSRLLPQALTIPSVMTVRTLADVKELLPHLPEDRRARPTWRHVVAQLDKAATSGDAADTRNR